MVEGESGLLAIGPPQQRPQYEPTKRRLTWPNGAIATTYSADEPERLRGPQHDAAWCDEIASWRYPEAWDMLMFGLRLGPDPRVVVTTTPKPIKIIRELIADPHHGDHARLDIRQSGQPRAGVSAADRTQVRGHPARPARAQRRDTGRRTRCPLVPRADRGDALAGRTKMCPDLVRIVVAIDPAASTGEDADETGIIVAGKDADGHGYVLADQSGRYPPTEWARAAIALYRRTRPIALSRRSTMAATWSRPRSAWSTRMSLSVHASGRSGPAAVKLSAAEPVAALYAASQIHHVGMFPMLEDQMCGFDRDFDRATAGYSPDRSMRLCGR